MGFVSKKSRDGKQRVWGRKNDLLEMMERT